MAQMTTKKFVIENIFGTLLVISFILQILITVFLRRIEIEHFEYLKTNWERPVYNNIIQSNGEGCEKGSENLFNYVHFKGTVEGGKDYFNKTIRMPNNETSLGINAIHSVDFNLSTYNKTYYCLKLDKSPSNYFSLRRASDKSGPQQSVPIGKDSYGNYLYDEKLNSVPNLERKRNDESIFSIDFILSENPPCINPNYGNKFKSLNKLDFYYGKNNCPNEEIFPYYEEFKIGNNTLEINKRTLLEENGILEKLKNLPDYNTDSFNTTTLKIYQIPYIGLNSGILFNNDNKGDVDKYISSINSLPTFNSILLISQLAFFIVYLVKFIVIITKYYRQKIKSPIYVKPTLMIISVINCIFVCIFFSKVISTPVIIEKIKEGKALDEKYYKILKPTFKAIGIILNLTWVSLIINIFLGIKYGIRTAIKLAS